MVPRVSIVIPVYNGANYLREAIDSALAQSYANIEVLVVNDGSADGGATERIARSYGTRIRYFFQSNGGVAAALNRGIREMSGEFFCWLSHDDRYLPGKTAAQVAFLEHCGGRIAGCDFEIIDERGEVTGEVRSELAVIGNGLQVLETYVFGCALMIHRSCFDGRQFNEANRTTQDLEMWLSLIEHDRIHWLDQVFAQVRNHASQGSLNEIGYASDKAHLFARIIDSHDASFFDPAAISPAARVRLYDRIAGNALLRNSLDGAAHALRRAWREMPSLRNPALLHILLGPRGWRTFALGKGWILGKAYSVKRRLLRWWVQGRQIP